MNDDQLEQAPDHNLRVHLLFDQEKPTFGDLFLIRGLAHPKFPPTNRFNFSALEHLEFDQVDDYFGIRSLDEEGDDVKVWLYPLVNGQSVYHHHGPFDGLELSYDVLRNSPEHGTLFLKVVEEFAYHLPVKVFYPSRNQDLGNSPDLTIIEEDINEVVSYYRAQGIEPGSEDALMLDF